MCVIQVSLSLTHSLFIIYASHTNATSGSLPYNVVSPRRRVTFEMPSTLRHRCGQKYRVTSIRLTEQVSSPPTLLKLLLMRGSTGSSVDVTGNDAQSRSNTFLSCRLISMWMLRSVLNYYRGWAHIYTPTSRLVTENLHSRHVFYFCTFLFLVIEFM